MTVGISLRAFAVSALAILPLSDAWAQTPAEFYKGKSVDIQIGYSVGGGYDVYARLIARYLGKYIPGNPTVVPRNMEGAASIRLANWIYNAAPKDGTAIGAVSRGAAFDPLLGSASAQFDASKYNWIGSANDEVSLCVSLATSGVNKFDDLLTKQLSIGSTGVEDDTYQFPAIMNGVLGTKFKMITGYPGGNDVSLAMERNEVQGRCGWSWSSLKSTKLDWVQSKKINLLVQMSLAKHPDLPDVPLVTEMGKTDEQQKIFKLIFARQVMGRPYMLPPGVPQDRVAAIRQAFVDTMKDPDFLAEAAKAKLEVTPVSGDQIQKLVEEIYKTPKELAAKAGQLIKAPAAP
jgi:tripartite-type tricarboxylate transporter receptor subunit TctC